MVLLPSGRAQSAPALPPHQSNDGPGPVRLHVALPPHTTLQRNSCKKDCSRSSYKSTNAAAIPLVFHLDHYKQMASVSPDRVYIPFRWNLSGCGFTTPRQVPSKIL